MRAFPPAVLVAMLISMATAGAAAADPKPDFDSRGASRIPAFSKGEKAAQADLRGDLGGDALVGRVSASRSAVAVTGLKDQLTDPSRSDPEQIALAYLRDNAVSFGLRAADIDALKLQDRYTSWEGTTHLIWVQTAGGVDAYDNKVGANVAKDGSVVNAWSTAIPDFGGDGTPVDQRRRGARHRLARCRRTRRGAPRGRGQRSGQGDEVLERRDRVADAVRHAGRHEARLEGRAGRRRSPTRTRSSSTPERARCSRARTRPTTPTTRPSTRPTRARRPAAARTRPTSTSTSAPRTARTGSRARTPGPGLTRPTTAP